MTMNFITPIYSAALPEIFLLCMASIILLVDVCLKERYSIITYLLIQLTLIATFVIVLSQYYEYPNPLVTFSGHYIVDKMAILTKLFVLVASFFAFIYARQYIKDRHILRGDGYVNHGIRLYFSDYLPRVGTVVIISLCHGCFTKKFSSRN
jgi:NADH-quinone oxidoreductase subunit N